VHEFLGTLVYESGGRSKIVHYWRMETSGEQAYELMDDVRAVDWLPLDAAVERLSRSYERAFLEHVGPLALAAAARVSRPARAKKQPAAEKRQRRQVVTPPAALPVPVSTPPQPDLRPLASGQDQRPLVDSDSVEAETSAATTAPEVVAPSAEEIEISAATIVPPVEETQSGNHAIAATTEVRRINLVQKVRQWLRRAA
jgi:8-oxo-dGTP diphosphatase